MSYDLFRIVVSTDSPISRRRVLQYGGLASTVPFTTSLSSGHARSGTSDGRRFSNERTDETGTDDGEDVEAEREGPNLPERGAVVFVYDDGPLEDYTQSLPVHQAFDAPATVGIVSNWVGRDDYQDSGCMDVEHLDELVAAGWEVASHTVDHTAVGTFELTKDAAPSASRLYPEEIRHGYHRGKTLEITDGEHAIHRVVTDYGTDEVGQYIDLDDAVGEICPAGETVVRYPGAQIREAMGESKRALERLGFEVDTFLAPYDSFDDYSRSFATEYYSGIANARHGTRVNDPDGFDPYRTRRDYFIEFTSPDSVKRDLDVIAEQGALGVIGAHTFKEEVTPERIGETLSWVVERGITVMTLREAIERCQ